MRETTPHIAVTAGSAVRRARHFDGLSVEVLDYESGPMLEYGYCGPAHLIIATDRGRRVDGETKLEGATASARRDLAGKLTFVPARHRFIGRFIPKIAPHSTYVFLRPSLFAECGIDPTDWPPRLFFDDADLWTTMQKLRPLAEQEFPGSDLYARALGLSLAVEIAKLEVMPPRPAPPSLGGLAPWQRRVLDDYIEAHLAEDIAVEELAALARLSVSHFSRAFKASFGMPPHRSIAMRRIGLAKSLLARRDANITRIAFACGFDHLSNFSTAFRRATGLTPRQFRSLR